jgi:hypothetical protein
MSANESHVVTANALAQRRADLIFELAEVEKRAAQLRADLIHLDAVLRMFRPELVETDLPIRRHRPMKSPHFQYSELTRRIYDALRPGEPVSSSDMASIAMRDKGIGDDPSIRADFVRRFTMQLNHLRRQGKVRTIGRGNTLRWRLPEN